jgi:hypothetical protein
VLSIKSDTLYFHSYSYFPPPYFSFASFPYSSSVSTSNSSCFCCCNQCSTCVLLARNSSISAGTSANLPAYPPYHTHPRPPSGGPPAVTISTVNRHLCCNPSNSISLTPAAAASSNYTHYPQFLQHSSHYTSSGSNSSHIYSNLNSLVVVGDETNIASTSSPTSPVITTATTTPTKRVQDDAVGDVQMVSMDRVL